MPDSGHRSFRSLIPVLLAACTCVALDVLSKRWALTSLTPGEPQEFIAGFLRFSLTSNTGAAFSIGQGHGAFMACLATTLTVALSIWAFNRSRQSPAPHPVEMIGIGCIIGGAIGNLIDRFTLGRVTDFLEFVFVSFPVFNVADALIDVGIGLIAIAWLCCGSKEQNQLAIQQDLEEAKPPEQAK